MRGLRDLKGLKELRGLRELIGLTGLKRRRRFRGQGMIERVEMIKWAEYKVHLVIGSVYPAYLSDTTNVQKIDR